MNRISLRYVLLTVTVFALLVWATALNIPHSFAPGEVISSAQVNENFTAVEAAVTALEAQLATVPAGSVVRTSNLLVNSNAATWVPFDFLQFGTSEMRDEVEPTRLVVPADGIYLASARVAWEANSDGRRSLSVSQNGVHRMSDDRSAAGVSSNSVSGLLRLNAEDYLEVRVYQDSGVALNLHGSSPVLQAVWVAPIP